MQNYLIVRGVNWSVKAFALWGRHFIFQTIDATQNNARSPIPLPALKEKSHYKSLKYLENRSLKLLKFVEL
jgi:hypothetical protein